MSLSCQGETFHPYHFSCSECGSELTSTAREVKTRPGLTANKVSRLCCLRCHDKLNLPICGACRRPIEDRVVTALGKFYCVDHFVCAKCEKPFLGAQYYERAGLAYCAQHYHQLYGELCYHCDGVIQAGFRTQAYTINNPEQMSMSLSICSTLFLNFSKGANLQ